MKRKVKLTWRTVRGAKGTAYPDWLRALKGKSGVYLIRAGEKIVYIGESHSNMLSTTLSRHFQKWDRSHKPGRDHAWSRATGHTYDRALVRVAVVVCSSRRAPLLQYDLIAHFKPRDNEVIGASLVEEVPF